MGDLRTIVRVLWCEVATIAIVLTGDISWWLSVIVLTLIPLFGLSHPSARWRIAARRVSVWMTVVYLFFFLVDLLVLSERLIFAIVHLTFYLKLYTLLHQDSGRERSRLHLLCLFEMLAAASMTVSAAFVLPLALFVLLGTLVLTLEQTRPKELTRSMLRGAVTTSAVVSIPLFGVAAVLFVTLPRATYGGFRLGGITGITVTGFSEEVRLGDFEEIRRDNGVVMRIIADDSAARPPRWRGPAYDRYQGGEWRQTLRGVSALPASREGRFLLDRPSAGPRARSEVFVEPLDTDVLFLPPASASIESSERYLYVDPYLTLRTGRSGRAGRRYAVFWRHQASPGTSPVGGVERLSNHARRLYTQVPESLSSAFHELASEVVGDRSGLDGAHEVERYLKSAFGYTLEAPPRLHDDPLEDFLFEARAGHCEYFATGMVMMLRSRGIPSRLVTGFNRGQINSVGEFEVVRKTNAHAWVEVYDSYRGWVSFDPTPPSVDIEQLARIGILSQGIDSLRMLWDMYVVAFDVERQRGVLGRARWLGDTALVAATRSFHFVRGHVFGLLAAVVAGIVLWLALRSRWGFSLRTRLLRRPRSGSSIAFYEKLLVLLERLGIERPAGQTPYAFAREREANLPGITELTTIYYRVRFGGEHLTRFERAHADRLCNAIRLAAISDARRSA